MDVYACETVNKDRSTSSPKAGKNTLTLRIDQLLTAAYLVPPSVLPDGLGLTLSSLHRQDKGGLEK